MAILPVRMQRVQTFIRFTAEPTQQSWGIMAMVADPDGNVLALWEDQLPETAEHDHEHGHIDQADGAS